MRKRISSLNQSVDEVYLTRTAHYQGIWLWGLLMCLTGCSSDLIVSKPIALHKAGSVVEANFELDKKDSVKGELWFFVNDQPGDRNRLIDLLDSVPRSSHSVSKSIIIPLKVKLIKYTNTEESVIVDKTYATYGLVGIGENFFSRQIDMWNIEPGKYRMSLETIETFPQFSNTKVEFKLYYIRAPK